MSGGLLNKTPAWVRACVCLGNKQGVFSLLRDQPPGSSGAGGLVHEPLVGLMSQAHHSVGRT
jgi:hypothetical protein